MKNREKDPFNWDSISIEMYYEIMDILNEEGDDDLTKNVRLVSVILDKDEQDIWDMELSEVGRYVSKLGFLEKFDIPSHPNMKVNLPGFDLEVMKDVTKINVAQYLDYQNFVRLPLRESIDKILSIFLIPKGHKYNEGYDIIELQAAIRQYMSFRIAEGLLGFFLKQYGRSLIRSLASYRRSIRKTKDPHMKEEMERIQTELKKRLDDLIHLTGYSSSTK